MSWSSFKIKAVYDDGSDTPIENAFVYVRFKDNNENFSNYYFSGYTGQNGIITVTSIPETQNYTKAVYRCVDERKFLQEGDIVSTIINNSQYLVYVDVEGAGIKFYFRFNLNDALYAAITTYSGSKPIMPKQIEIYTKNRDETYTLHSTITANTISLNNYFYTTDLRFEGYFSNGDLYFTKDINYKEALLGLEIGGWFLCDEYYDFKLPLVNDTINWQDTNVTLKNVDFEITLTYNSVPTPPSTTTLISSSNETYLRAYLVGWGGGTTPFFNVIDPSLNTIKASKNHYNDSVKNISISATTLNGEFSEYVIMLSGETIDTPIILEREPNVCMINEDLYDYVASLTDITPNMSNFSDYYTDDDLMKKVGISKLPFYNDWISAITQYLPQQYQGQTASTLNDFKMLFVSAISTDYVQTMYTLSPQVESQYGAYSNHGYVWDRCFIPISAETFDNCLTFVPSLTKSVNELPKISLSKVGSPTDVQIEYRIGENGSWNSYTFNTDISFNDRISFRRAPSNTGITFSTANGYYNFQIKNNAYTIILSGSVTSLLDGKGKNDTALSDFCFRRLFEGCGISQASSLELPTMSLAARCYESMFADCSGLATAPNLPATSLSNHCYANMFYNCVSLIDAPALSVTNLANSPGCYSQMFLLCASLTSAPSLPATALSSYCYFSMFAGCTSLTTVQQTLPALTLASYCYQQMFQGCTSLTTPPSLPATNLTGADYCYSTMFGGCTSLTAVPNLPATVLAPYCYSQMFSLCEHITSMPSLAANQLAEGCYQRMFTNCYLLTGVTNLNASRLAVKCYESMFENCTSLQTPPQFNSTAGLMEESCKKTFKGCTSLSTIPTNSVQSWQALGVSCFEEMFRGCTSLALLPTLLPAQTAKDYCYKGMFAYCTNLNVRSNGFSILAGNLQNTSGVCESMFEGCISMTSGITPNSVKLGPDSYKRMFYGCYNMSYIKQNFSATTSGVFNSNNASAFTEDWVSGVSLTGKFVIVNQTWFDSYAFYGPNGIPDGYGWRIATP